MNWRGWTACLLAALLLCALTACQNEKRVEGLVVEVQTDADGGLTAFVLENGGERTGVLIAEKTSLWPKGIGSGTLEEFRAQFQEELQIDTLASVWCYPRRDKLETEDGATLRAYWATIANITGELCREALTLQDGTGVDILEYDTWGAHTYRLADGTELLRVDGPWGPENVYVMNLEDFDDLNEQAQERVRHYYGEQGLLYNEMAELERAYAAYLEQEKDFQSGRLEQSVSPCGASERVMYFLSSVSMPLDYGERTSTHLEFCAAFDRESGEKVETRDLFGVSWAEVRRRLPELVDWDMDPAIAAQISEKLEPEYLSFYPDYMSVWFPAGTLEGEEYSYGFSISYSDAPEGFFQPWAIPESAEE